MSYLPLILASLLQVHEHKPAPLYLDWELDAKPVRYVIQASTNLQHWQDWETTTRPPVMVIPTNRAMFFRLKEANQ